MGSKTDCAIPFKGQQPYDMPSGLVIPSVLDLSSCDEKLLVPQAPDVSFRLLPLLRFSRLLHQHLTRTKIWYTLPTLAYRASGSDDFKGTMALS